MIILGIDPGFAITGYGVIECQGNHLKMLEYGVVSTKAGTPFTWRLLQIRDQLNELLAKYKPDACAVEELFFNSNTTTAIQVAQGRGVAITTVADKGIPIFEYTPLQVKSAVTGYGQAQKPQVMEMTKRLLRLEKVPKPDDTADALAIAICHAQMGGTALKRQIMRGV